MFFFSYLAVSTSKAISPLKIYRGLIALPKTYKYTEKMKTERYYTTIQTAMFPYFFHSTSVGF